MVVQICSGVVGVVDNLAASFMWKPKIKIKIHYLMEKLTWEQNMKQQAIILQRSQRKRQT